MIAVTSRPMPSPCEVRPETSAARVPACASAPVVSTVGVALRVAARHPAVEPGLEVGLQHDSRRRAGRAWGGDLEVVDEEGVQARAARVQTGADVDLQRRRIGASGRREGAGQRRPRAAVDGRVADPGEARLHDVADVGAPGRLELDLHRERVLHTGGEQAGRALDAVEVVRAIADAERLVPVDIDHAQRRPAALGPGAPRAVLEVERRHHGVLRGRGEGGGRARDHQADREDQHNELSACRHFALPPSSQVGPGARPIMADPRSLVNRYR